MGSEKKSSMGKKSDGIRNNGTSTTYDIGGTAETLRILSF